MPTPLDPIIERMNAGESVRTICADLGVEHTTIYKRLAKAGISLPKQGWSATLTLPADPGVLAYIAGLMDGEGCISHTTKGHWHVRICMTYKPVIDWLAQFGGNIQFENRAHDPTRKDAWTWNVSRWRDVEVLLTAILPWMIVKRGRAEECLTSLRK